MLDRFLGIDIRDYVLSYLEDNFENMLSTIDAERGTSTPTPSKFSYFWDEEQIYAVIVDLGDSELTIETLSDDYTLCTEIFNLDIFAIIVDSSLNLHNYVENYIEAMVRCLHGLKTEDISWIVLTGTQRNDLYNNTNEIAKEARATFKVRIN